MASDFGAWTKWATIDSTAYTTSNNLLWCVTDSGSSSAEKRKKKAAPKPETNLAWLDRRVDEMRVEL